MWTWIYRIIAAVLAMMGAAVLDAAARAWREGADTLSQVFGPAAMVLIVLMAIILLISAVLILASPAARRSPPR